MYIVNFTRTPVVLTDCFPDGEPRPHQLWRRQAEDVAPEDEADARTNVRRVILWLIINMKYIVQNNMQIVSAVLPQENGPKNVLTVLLEVF